VLALNALVTDEDREWVTEMHTDEWRRGVPIRAGGLPRGGRNRSHTAVEMWNSGELIRLPGGDLSGEMEGELERVCGGIGGVN
jgi:hypothetical protein